MTVGDLEADRYTEARARLNAALEAIDAARATTGDPAGTWPAYCAAVDTYLDASDAFTRIVMDGFHDAHVARVAQARTGPA